MASLKTICIAILALAFVGFAVQLGGLASMTDTGCRGKSTYSPFSNSTLPAMTRKLQQTKYELSARCSFGLSLDWWSVFFQFAVVSFGLFAAFTERMFQARIRVALLFAVALTWAVVRASEYLPGVVARSSLMRDEGFFESDAVQTNKDWVSFISTRTYIAGAIISSVSYFAFILFGLGEFASA